MKFIKAFIRTLAILGAGTTINAASLRGSNMIIHGSDDAPTTNSRPTSYPPAPAQSNEEGVPPLVHVPPHSVEDEQPEEEAYAAFNRSFTLETAQDDSQHGSAPFFGGKAPRKSSTTLYNTDEAYAAYGADKPGSAPLFGTTGSTKAKAPRQSSTTFYDTEDEEVFVAYGAEKPGSAPFFGTTGSTGGKAPRKSSPTLYNAEEAYAAYGAEKLGSAPFFGTTGSTEGKASRKSDPTQNMEA